MSESEKIKEFSKAYKLRIAEYTPENSFDKQYKFSLVDKDGEELCFVSGIKKVEMNFEYTWKQWDKELAEWKTRAQTYQNIIDRFQDRLNIEVKDLKND